MVDNRQVLKNNVEADIRKKIQSAQKVLGDLRGAVLLVEENSTKAKGEVNQAVQSIQQLISNRKRELTRQIDIICHKQISSLHDEIQSTYLALGSLQSTLSNLDSFDHTQLRSLHIPNLTTECKTWSEPSPVELKVNNAVLDESIRDWGSVSSKGLKGLFDVGTSVSLPPRFVEYQDSKSGQEFMSHKPVTCGSNSVITVARQPKLPCTPKNTTETVPVTAGCGFEMRDIEEWLSGVKLQTSENDDFEIVSIEDTNSTKRNDPTTSLPEKGGDNKQEFDAASIVCWQNEENLSKWLKPKKTCEKENMTPTTEKRCHKKAYIHNPLKNRFVDFPCLRTEPLSWVPPKRAKLNVSELTFPPHENFPPEYSLPAPFWLKKHC